jgi:hypothetical protein
MRDNSLRIDCSARSSTHSLMIAEFRWPADVQKSGVTLTQGSIRLDIRLLYCINRRLRISILAIPLELLPETLLGHLDIRCFLKTARQHSCGIASQHKDPLSSPLEAPNGTHKAAAGVLLPSRSSDLATLHGTRFSRASTQSWHTRKADPPREGRPQVLSGFN